MSRAVDMNASLFPYLDPSKDYISNISNPFYIEKSTQLNLFSLNSDSSTSEFLFLLAEWFVIFSCIMEVNVAVYKLTQSASILPLFKRKGHQEFNEFLVSKRKEYRAYSIALLSMSALQILQSFIEYFLWRGTQYFSIPQPYYMACILQEGNNGTTLNCTDWQQYNSSFQPMNYSRYPHAKSCDDQGKLSSGVHNCLSRNDPGVVAAILVWYTLRLLLNSLNLFFVFVLLDRNKKGTRGQAFIQRHLRWSLFWCLLVIGAEFLLLNAPYNYRLYFYFQTLGVLIILMFEKVLLFFVLFDRYSVKDWTDNKLRSKHIHIKGIEWRDEYNTVMGAAFEQFRERFTERKQADRLFRDRQVEIMAVYEQNFERYAQQEIFEKHFWSYDHKPQKLFEVAWSKYINYLLVVTVMGIVGYFMMILPTAAAYQGKSEMKRIFTTDQRLVFLTGYFLAMLEIVLIRITKDIYLTNTLFRDIVINFESRSKKLKCEFFAEF